VDVPLLKGIRAENAGRETYKASLMSAAMLEGEQPELLRLAIKIAKRGNVPMLKFLLARWLPRERLIKIALPQIISAGDALKALQDILRAVSAGTISPAEGAALTALLTPFIDRSAGKPPGGDLVLSLTDHLQSLDKE